jgi:FkbM family methyltransferase
MIIESDGLQWLVDEQLSGDRIGPDHEASLRDKVLALIPEGGTFIDVGAHVGCYSLRAQRRGAEVHAIEPNPDAMKRLLDNLDLNRIENVVVYGVAAWDRYTVLSLASPNGFPRDASMRTIPTAEGIIQGVALDDLLWHVDRADLIKLDVKGSDLQALEGMRELVDRLRPVLIIEDHSVLGYFSPEALQEKIHSLYYKSEIFGTYGGANYWLCRPEENNT